METTEREGLDSIAWTEGQADWRAGKVKKLKPGAEDSRSTAWRMDQGRRDRAEAEGGLRVLDKASATAFLAPETWGISLVNSEI